MADPIEDYLARLARELVVAPETREAILEEVRGHLEAAVAGETAQGVERTEAAERAVRAFGPLAPVAGGLNALHPVSWDGRRMLVGMAWGIGVLWALWTLFTYPLLVLFATRQPSYSIVFGAVDPARLLFDATPLAFGLFRVLTYGSPWLVLVFLLLYGVTPFLWGRRSRQGWKPGLAFGLGAFVGLPWLIPGVVLRWAATDTSSGVGMLVGVLAIWLLLPYAMLASWLGHRAAFGFRRRAAGSRRRWRRLLARAGSSAGSRRRGWSAVAAVACVALVLAGANVWAWSQAETVAAAKPTVAQQLRAAQAAVSFPLHQPGFVPEGYVLTSVGYPQESWQSGVTLTYSGPGGGSFNVGQVVSHGADDPLPAPPNYQVSDVTGGSVHPVWWLNFETTSVHEINLTWSDGNLDFFLGSNGALPLDTLKLIAASV